MIYMYTRNMGKRFPKDVNTVAAVAFAMLDMKHQKTNRGLEKGITTIVGHLLWIYEEGRRSSTDQWTFV